MSPDGRLLPVVPSPGADGVVVLVHGLGSDAATTWGTAGEPHGVVDRLRRARPDLAVACFDYPSGLGAPGPGVVPPLARLAARFAAVLRDDVLPAHRRVALVGYCLGGMVVRFALAGMYGGTGGPEPGRVVVHLLDTPEDWPREPLDPLAAAVVERLELGAGDLRRNARWWADRAGPAGRVVDHAVLGAGRCWITPFAPGSTVPPSRVRRSRLAHLDLATPAADGPHPTCDAVLADLARLVPARG